MSAATLVGIFAAVSIAAIDSLCADAPINSSPRP